ncbi:hypothetical protein [Breoghania sp.]|nr:hypothetical protein [Breoghania sp.]MDJ0933320.1 hypothetical protein [Breoghania sp.]
MLKGEATVVFFTDHPVFCALTDRQLIIANVWIAVPVTQGGWGA